jgi:membrane carboxypeptidase/penicillin-binding protein PbpC
MSFVSSESNVLSCCLSRCCGSDPIRDGTHAPLCPASCFPAPCSHLACAAPASLVCLVIDRAPFGGNLEGVQAASFAYLGKSAAKLTHAEAALLAVLPQAPSRYRPDRHPERARAARDKVMQRLVAQGVWPEPVLARGHFTPMEATLFARLAADSQPGAPHRWRSAALAGGAGGQLYPPLPRADLSCPYGQSAAVPLLLSVYSRLADNSPLPVQPNTVSEAEICWPLGRKASATLPQTCLQRQSAWLLEARDPPTLPDPMDWPSPLRQVALTAEGKPTLARCQDAAQASFRALWPLSLEPWRKPGERRQALLASGCAGERQSAELQAPIRIVALGEGNLIRSQRYRLQPKVLGGVGKPFWFLNGQRLRWDGDRVLSEAGRYQLVVVDEAGNSDRVEFRLENPS